MRKTTRMRLMEIDHGGRDIRLLMREAYRETGSRERAAVRLGISRQTFIMWEFTLGIDVSDSDSRFLERMGTGAARDIRTT